MRYLSILMISLCLFFPSVLLANNVTPIAVITHDIEPLPIYVPVKSRESDVPNDPVGNALTDLPVQVR